MATIKRSGIELPRQTNSIGEKYRSARVDMGRCTSLLGLRLGRFTVVILGRSTSILKVSASILEVPQGQGSFKFGFEFS